jgi:hypothetical protein
MSTVILRVITDQLRHSQYNYIFTKVVLFSWIHSSKFTYHFQLVSDLTPIMIVIETYLLKLTNTYQILKLKSKTQKMNREREKEACQSTIYGSKQCIQNT